MGSYEDILCMKVSSVSEVRKLIGRFRRCQIIGVFSFERKTLYRVSVERDILRAGHLRVE